MGIKPNRSSDRALVPETKENGVSTKITIKVIIKITIKQEERQRNGLRTQRECQMNDLHSNDKENGLRTRRGVFNE